MAFSIACSQSSRLSVAADIRLSIVQTVTGSVVFFDRGDRLKLLFNGKYPTWQAETIFLEQPVKTKDKIIIRARCRILQVNRIPIRQQTCLLSCNQNICDRIVKKLLRNRRRPKKNWRRVFTRNHECVQGNCRLVDAACRIVIDGCHFTA